MTRRLLMRRPRTTAERRAAEAAEDTDPEATLAAALDDLAAEWAAKRDPVAQRFGAYAHDARELRPRVQSSIRRLQRLRRRIAGILERAADGVG